MPLPLPNLDTRQWSDLVDEGRALIPRYAPDWSDENYSDPGITITELLAWFIEQDVYRVNRVPDRHRLKFLQLIGFNPFPPRAATVPLTIPLQSPATQAQLPAGTLFQAADTHGHTALFRTLHDLTSIAASIVTIQVDDGTTLVDWTRFWGQGRPIPAFGPDPGSAPGTYTARSGDTVLSIAQLTEATAEAIVALNRLSGLERHTAERAAAPASTPRRPLPRLRPPAFPRCSSLSLAPARRVGSRTGGTRTDRAGTGRAGRLLPARAPARYLPALSPTQDPWCPVDEQPPSPSPSGTTATALLTHYSARTVWEYYAAETPPRWKPLDPAAGQVSDDTRSLTLDGAVQIKLPSTMAARALGTVSDQRYYLRCRFDTGQYDAAPALLDVAANTVLTEQAAPIWQDFAVAPGAPISGPAPIPGKTTRLTMALDETGTITALTFAPAKPDLPNVLVLDYTAPAGAVPGGLTLDLVQIGNGNGRALQSFWLPSAPVQDGALELWTLEGSRWRAWELRPDLDASHRSDLHVTLLPANGLVAGGDGEQGRVFPDGAPVVARYHTTLAGAGNLPAAISWTLPDNAYNLALIPGLAALRGELGSIANRLPTAGGADAETIQHATGRAAETLWAHERLVQLAQTDQSPTLDQHNRSAVLALRTPERAVTLLDFERLALDVPGTVVARARAWAAVDPAYPCLLASGTVTIVIVPQLPLGRPEPSDGLLRWVRIYLNRRRVVGTRLVVVGPEYLEVSVRSTLHLKTGADPARVMQAVTDRLNTFFDPLQGGPAGYGWPFGRHVYRTEVLQVVGGVQGVDHVTALELIPAEGEAECGNLCVGPTSLVRSGQHTITIA